LHPDDNGLAIPIEIRPFEQGGPFRRRHILRSRLQGYARRNSRSYDAQRNIACVIYHPQCLLSLEMAYMNTIKHRTDVLLQIFLQHDHMELEYVATGFQGVSSYRSIKMLIGMIRFAVHLIYMATNPSIRAHYQSLGVTISAAVAAISLGTVMIPPEAVAWVLMSAASIINGGKEAAQLCKGAEIALWPGKSARNIPMRYRDYVRLFIVMQSPDAIAKRLSHVVFQACPGVYYTAARTTLFWEEISYEYVSGYLRRKEAEITS